MDALHVISQQAIEEERSRRRILIRRNSSDDLQSILSSVQYRDLLSMNLDMFKSPLANLDTGECIPAATTPLPVWGADDAKAPVSAALQSGSPMSYGASPRVASPRVASPRVASPRVTSPREAQQAQQAQQALEPCTPLELGANAMSLPNPVRPSSCGEIMDTGGAKAPADSAETIQPEVRIPHFRHVSSHSYADHANDKFANRIPFIRHLSLSYGGEQYQNAAALSVNLPPPKLDNAKKLLTMEEQEILSKEGGGVWRA